MTLTKLYDQVVPDLPASIATNLKTAIKVLAQALNYQDPSHCPQEAFTRPLPDLYRLVEAHLLTQGKSDITIRNTKNYLSRMFRVAKLEMPTTHPRPRFGERDSAHRPGSSISRQNGHYLPFRQWPAPLQRAFKTFEHWATQPLSQGRDAKWQKRPTTVAIYRTSFESYFGYLYHTRHIRQPTFNHLFDFGFVRAYVHWDINKIHGKPTRLLKCFITNLLALTHQYHPLPDFHAQLIALNRKIPTPPPHYNKTDAWVPTAEIAAIGRDLWPCRPPINTHHDRDGSRFAMRAGLSLAFQLWSFIPYRSRNMREMACNTNLCTDDGKWRIVFAGEQLKVAVKRGQRNVFDLPFPKELVPTLEQYLDIWRPILTHKSRRPTATLLLNSRGNPYTPDAFRSVTKATIYRYTGKFWHPHIHRTVWATEWIRDKNPGDFYSAAEMLNDTLQTVIDRYSYLLGDGIAEKVYERLSQHQTKAAFSAEAKRLLVALAEKLEISQSAVLELLNRSS
jgi:hypothetical protein